LTQGYVPVEIWWAKILIAIYVIIEGMRKNLEEVFWKTKQSSWWCKYLSFFKKTLLYDVVIVVVVKVFVFSQLGLFRFVKPFLSSRKPYYVHCLAFLSLCSLVHCFCCCLLSIEVLHFCFHYTTALTCFFFYWLTSYLHNCVLWFSRNKVCEILLCANYWFGLIACVWDSAVCKPLAIFRQTEHWPKR
jgi:hypothetical protein